MPARACGFDSHPPHRKNSVEAAEEKTSPGKDEPKADVLGGGPTGIAGSDLDRKGAARLLEELESKGRSGKVVEVRIPASDSLVVTVHALLTVAASLIALKWPAIGASICLIAIFSFYSERGL